MQPSPWPLLLQTATIGAILFANFTLTLFDLAHYYLLNIPGILHNGQAIGLMVAFAYQPYQPYHPLGYRRADGLELPHATTGGANTSVYQQCTQERQVVGYRVLACGTSQEKDDVQLVFAFLKRLTSIKYILISKEVIENLYKNVFKHLDITKVQKCLQRPLVSETMDYSRDGARL
jgi:hypothetical protein